MGLVNKCGSCGSVYAGEACPQCADTARRDMPTPELEAKKQLGGFEILGKLGEGGMGVVYRARQIALDRVVALKTLPASRSMDPEFQNRFEREAKAMATLSHPNIIPVFDFGREKETYYFAMEWVDSGDLRKKMDAGRLPVAETIDIITQLLDALEYAHESGIVHRDLKPENILIDANGRPRIVDFGLALLTDPDTQNLTMTGTRMGTASYASPEQQEDSHAVDHRTDLYSLGVMFYEMLTGGIPRGKFGNPSEKSDSDPRLDEVILQTLEQDPDRRPRDAKELQEKIRSTLAGAKKKPEAPAKPKPGGLLIGIAGGALLCAVILGLVFFLPGSADPTPNPTIVDFEHFIPGPEDAPSTMRTMDESQSSQFGIPENPFHADTPEDLGAFRKMLHGWGFPNVGKLKQAYLHRWNSCQIIILETPRAEELAPAFKRMEVYEDRWVHREGDILLFVHSVRNGVHSLFQELVSRMKKKLGEDSK